MKACSSETAALVHLGTFHSNYNTPAKNVKNKVNISGVYVAQIDLNMIARARLQTETFVSSVSKASLECGLIGMQNWLKNDQNCVTNMWHDLELQRSPSLRMVFSRLNKSLFAIDHTMIISNIFFDDVNNVWKNGNARNIISQLQYQSTFYKTTFSLSHF